MTALLIPIRTFFLRVFQSIFTILIWVLPIFRTFSTFTTLANFAVSYITFIILLGIRILFFANSKIVEMIVNFLLTIKIEIPFCFTSCTNIILAVYTIFANTTTRICITI